jgi:malonate transporter MadL subunit
LENNNQHGIAKVIDDEALLAACLLAGLSIGEMLGQLPGAQVSVGGVGMAMLLLVQAGRYSRLQSVLFFNVRALL